MQRPGKREKARSLLLLSDLWPLTSDLCLLSLLTASTPQIR
jgi:hypothetical protein